MTDDYALLLKQYGQEHLLDYLPMLGEREQKMLLADIDQIDLDALTDLYHSYTANHNTASNDDIVVEQAEVLSFHKPSDATDERKRLYAEGESLLSAGKVALFLVAGGQGTRLGFDGPKGCFPISPVAAKSLFQLFAESVLALQRRYCNSIPWYIMTSQENNTETTDFFQTNLFFGLDPASVHFIVQQQIPSLTLDGKLIVGENKRIFKNPNGHGGSLYALHESGALQDMSRRGIEEIFYFQVDNPLVNIADPLFIGAHRQHGADMSTKVVEKIDPSERVGIIGKLNGRLSCIEYSELTDEQARERLDDGRLRFSSANIAIHMINRRFVERLIASSHFHLPYHFAVKDIVCLVPEASRLISTTMKGIKCEMFVFDALGSARNAVTLEVSRGEEFSPVKNADGSDSPHTARRSLSARYAGWLRRSAPHLSIPDSFVVEVSPLYALTEEEFSAKYTPPLHIASPLYIE